MLPVDRMCYFCTSKNWQSSWCQQSLSSFTCNKQKYSRHWNYSVSFYFTSIFNCVTLTLLQYTTGNVMLAMLPVVQHYKSHFGLTSSKQTELNSLMDKVWHKMHSFQVARCHFDMLYLIGLNCSYLYITSCHSLTLSQEPHKDGGHRNY